MHKGVVFQQNFSATLDDDSEAFQPSIIHHAAFQNHGSGLNTPLFRAANDQERKAVIHFQQPGQKGCVAGTVNHLDQEGMNAIVQDSGVHGVTPFHRLIPDNGSKGEV